MKKQRFLALLTILMLTFTLSGCGLKLIEKAPEREETTQKDTMELGVLDEIDDTEEHMEVTKPESTEAVLPPSIVSQSSETVDETPSQTQSGLPEGQQEINGVIFQMNKQEMYVKEDCKLYQNAKLTGAPVSGLSKASRVSIQGVSLDNKIAMIQISTGAIYYADYSYFTKDKVEYEEPVSSETSQQPETPPSSSSQQQPENPPSSSQQPETPPSSSQQPETPPSSSQQPSTPPSSSQQPQQPQQPQYPQGGGIKYPSNPSSVSINFGINFADEDFTATVLAHVTMNSGPGEVLNSTGYYVVETFESGTSVHCTGIGQNGYIRVVLADGTIGFIDGRFLKR